MTLRDQIYLDGLRDGYDRALLGIPLSTQDAKLSQAERQEAARKRMCDRARAAK